METRRSRRARKHAQHTKRRRRVAAVLKGVFSALLIALIAGAVFGIFFVYATVKDLPHYDPAEIQASLATMSTIYDDEGNEIKDVYTEGGQRVLVTYEQIPENLINALVAVEDKTFWTHNGFNFVRIFGAVKDAVLHGGGISGTSTITQQLARNIWLFDTRSDRTITRKIKEAWYTRELERGLSKEDILTAYLNTISLGNHSYGVGAAAEGYFGKNISELDLLECAALAAMPQQPGTYSLIATVGIGEVAPDDPRVLLVTDQYIYLYNDAAETRIELILDLMEEQGYITEEECEAAKAENIRDRLKPTPIDSSGNATFFIDYLLNDVAEDMLEAYPGQFANLDAAVQAIYTGGFEIHSTLNTRIQNITSEELENASNYPAAQIPYDGAGNALSESGSVLLYAYKNMFDERDDGAYFKLNADDFEMQEDGSMLIKKGRRLGIYDTTNPDGTSEVAVEFRDFFTMDEGVFRITKGGIISIPTEYKSLDEDGNLVLSAAFFASDANIFTAEEDGTYSIAPSHFSLRQSVIQPQGAATVIEHHTGQIKAMFGGRDISGQLQFNRATNPHSPGSTMKPIGAYGPALQMSADGEKAEGSDTFGTYWTPISIIEDSQMEYKGEVWPVNWYSGYRGPQTLRTAVQQSINVCAVKVQLAVGNERSVKFLKKLGITTLVEEGSTTDLGPGSLALGGMTNGVKPIEITSAYGVFANNGVRVEPISYTSVTDRAGNLVLDGEPEQTQAMDAGAAYIMNDILRTTVENGIAGAAKVAGVPVAGKTGTNEKRNYDAWFVGNTPQYSMGVWLGCDVKIPMSQNSSASASLFSKIMSRVYEGKEPGTFEAQPENVVSASVDGYTDIFIKGTVPGTVEGDDSVEICTESGYLATPWCTDTEKKSATAGQSVPEYYCNLHNADIAQFPIDPFVAPNTNFNKKTVPDLVGLFLEDAAKALTEAGLSLGVTTSKASDAPSGQVLSQSATPEALLDAGATVDITISAGN